MNLVKSNSAARCAGASDALVSVASGFCAGPDGGVGSFGGTEEETLGSIVGMLVASLATGFCAGPDEGVGSFGGTEEETLGCIVGMLVEEIVALGLWVRPDWTLSNLEEDEGPLILKKKSEIVPLLQ